MKKLLTLFAFIMALLLVLLQLPSATFAAEKSKSTNSTITDKNKDGLPDSWEKKFNLKGSNLGKKDNDKDGVSNLWEYKLKLNPISKDSDHDGVKDGKEDNDED